MKELKYIEKIRQDDLLLSLPQSLAEVLSMVGSEDYSIDDLIRIIMKDAGLTSRILKMANSSFYGHRNQISTLHQAVMMLGIMQVKCLALSASVFQIRNLQTKYHIDIKGMFSHFIGVALACKMLSDVVDCESGDELFVAGLLHDIGLVYFIHHFPDDYKQVVDRLKDYRTRAEAERAILGIDHAELGLMLAEKWGFPPSLCKSISDHHKIPSRIDKIEMVHVVQLADMLNTNFTGEHPRLLETRLALANHMIKLLNVDRQAIDQISYAVLNETVQTAEHLGIDIGDPNEALVRANRELFNSFITIEHLFRERQDLSQRILVEERRAATMETKNVAIATLSHYVSNATMAISGRAQLLKMLKDRGSLVDKDDKLNSVLEVIEKSVKKIMAVIHELRDLTNLEEMEKYSESNAINIDDRVQKRILEMEKDPGLVIPTDEMLYPRH